MLDYEWTNASTIVLSGDDQSTQEPDATRSGPIFDPTHQSFSDQHHHILSQPGAGGSLSGHHVVGFNQAHNQVNQFHHSFYDPRASFGGESTYAHNHHPAAAMAAAAALFSLDQTGAGPAAAGAAYFVVPKTEEVSRPSQLDFTPSRIGLNLGGRTYFSAADDDFVSRLYRRSRPGEAGAGSSLSSARCQAEGCNADLSHAKHYHRRHKVCEFHSKASTVIAAGLTQRFCQQCSRFHLLSEFDNGKRSCRKRLADHNRRRRKSHQSAAATATVHDNPKPPPEIANPRSPNESGAQSSSSVNVPLSPPTISLDCFRQRQYQATASSSSASSSSNSIFFSSG